MECNDESMTSMLCVLLENGVGVLHGWKTVLLGVYYSIAELNHRDTTWPAVKALGVSVE